MSRPKGSKNKTYKLSTRSVHVRLTRDELAKLKTINRSPGKAIHALIAAHETQEERAAR